MSLQRRFVTSDEELGKKDDDHHYRGHLSPFGSPLATTFTWRGPRRKRVLLLLTLLCALFFFFRNLPKDAIVATHRAAVRHPSPGASRHTAPSKRPPRFETSVESKHYYEGPLKYPNLAASFGAALGPIYDDRNVLFVASSPKSAASLLPVACDMSNYNENRVHMMLAGRDDLSIEDIEEINGVSEADCSIRWHDGRPDFSTYSTDYRMEASVRTSFGHLAAAMRPSVVLIDRPERKDAFLSKAIKEQTELLGVALIELPTNAAENLNWISKLAASALKSWRDVSVEILIHAPPAASGSIIRLLKSLESADYFGFPLPRLTIELPNKIDPPISQFLSTFRWPPDSHTGSSRLIVRHRISSVKVDAAQASVHQIESFYPANVPDSNVLVLSPQVELSPLYFQYLMYNLLEYKYSKTSSYSSAKLLGISLEVPRTTLDNQEPLPAPGHLPLRSPFLFQSPNSNAALYFGDKWVELHSFLSNRLAVGDANAMEADFEITYPVAKTHPSWLSYTLELCRSRGYTMLYPSPQSPDDSLASIHTELYHPPEEHGQGSNSNSISSSPQSIPNSTPATKNDEDDDDDDNEDNNNNTTNPANEQSAESHFLPRSLRPLDLDSPLPDLSTLPVLSHTGQFVTGGQMALDQAAITFSEAFASELGGCGDRGDSGDDDDDDDDDEKATTVPPSARPRRKRWSADDLFCL